MKVIESNSKLNISVKTHESAAASIRERLGMSESEESEGFFSPRSKRTVQYGNMRSPFNLCIFWTPVTSVTNDILKHLYRSSSPSHPNPNRNFLEKYPRLVYTNVQLET